MPSSTPPAKIKCTKCGVLLHVPPSQTAVSGPCPLCGTLLTAPGNHGSVRVSTRRQGRIAADSAIDHEALEKRESLQTLKILVLFALVIACCLAAAWFLKR